MTQILIKLEQGMDQVIHGVNKYKNLALYNLPLSLQILAINFFITIIGFIFLVFFNYFLIKTDDTIEQKKINAKQNLLNIQAFLEKNSIIRVPVFDDNCTVGNIETCKSSNNFELSDPVLEPKITQEFIVNNYLNSDYTIKIYNDDWIRLVDTLDLYDLSLVQETELNENDLENSEINLYLYFSQKYLKLFSKYHSYLIKREFQNAKTQKRAEISYVADSIKYQLIKEYIIEDISDSLVQYFTAPIISNNKVYGVIILNYTITDQVADLSFISLNILGFFVLFVLIMIFMSLIFSQSLVRPIKKLSRLTILERERVYDNKITYPVRKDEIGVLSNEIKNMSSELKIQIQQLEKFSEDVSHELKNPLTSLQSAIELIRKNNLSKENENLLFKNIKYDLKRMNQIITDISNFTRLKAEIELEKNEYININKFLDEIPQIFISNPKKIKFILSKCDKDLHVVANKNKLIQVFINLIENSISLSPEGSKILIEISKFDENNISIRFYDQGKGVNIKDSEKIFERFYSDRQDNIKNHTGLGLSIAREIINHMNGKISLNKSNKSEYSGACFLIILPVRHFKKN